MKQTKIFITSAPDEEKALEKILSELYAIGILAKGKILKQTLNGNYFVETEFDVTMSKNKLNSIVADVGDGMVK